MRSFGRGQLIGPVIAVDDPGARAMIAHLLGQRIGQFVRVDVPKESGLAAWLPGLGLEDAGTVIRMVRGRNMAPSRQARVFALARELGLGLNAAPGGAQAKARPYRPANPDPPSG